MSRQPFSWQSSALQTALDDGTDEINGYLMHRFTLPLADPPKILVVKNIDIALYKLFRGERDSVEYRAYEQAVRYLNLLAEGRINLMANTEARDDGSGGVSAEAPPRLFTEDTLKGFS